MDSLRKVAEGRLTSKKLIGLKTLSSKKKKKISQRKSTLGEFLPHFMGVDESSVQKVGKVFEDVEVC